jgi:hypothetical protein
MAASPAAEHHPVSPVARATDDRLRDPRDAVLGRRAAVEPVAAVVLAGSPPRAAS